MSDIANLHELTKKELQVEAQMRDIQFEQSWTAARILQKLREVPIQKDYQSFCPKVTTIKLELQNLQVARDVLQEYFEQCVEQPTSHRKVRLRACLNHWLYRVQGLTKLVSDDERMFVTEIEKEFLEYMNWTSQVTADSDNQHLVMDNTTNAEEGASSLANLSSFSGLEGTKTLVPNRTMVINETCNVNQKEASNLATVVSPPLQYDILKIENPLSSILKQTKDFSVVSRDSILQFLNVFVKLCRQAAFLKIHDLVIMKMLYPYCRGMLSKFVCQAIELEYTLDKFHTEFLAAYLPLTVVSRFITEFVLRPQRVNEPLGEYIQLVKLHSEMFRTTYTEAQLVEIIIMNSIRPEVRSLYLSTAAPTTFAELSSIVIKLNQCDTGDTLRSYPSSQQFRS